MLLLAGQVSGQRSCGSMEYHKNLLATDPVYRANRERIENLTAKYLATMSGQVRKAQSNTITIPVVVHVLWNTPDQNIADERIFEQIKILNDDFNRRNADAANTPAPFAALAGTYNIEFCLAPWQDEQGKWQAPITRTQTNVAAFTQKNEAKKFSTGGHDIVNPGEYLNFWVCPLKGSLLGYAQFPGGLPEFDGVVMTTYAFGITNGGPTGRFGLGRTTTHEVGHWLNLYHIWGDRPCGDDLVEDTPQALGANFNVPTYPHNVNSCGDTPNGEMFMNFMDYSDDVAMNMFTQGQVDRSRALFANSGIKETYLASGFLCKTSAGLGNSCPCIPPQNPRVIKEMDNSIQIGWAPDNSAPKRYEIRYRKSVGGSWTTLPLTTDTLVDITGLDRSQLYMFQVKALCTRTNLSSEWRSLVAGTAATKVLCDDISVQVLSKTATTLELSWSTSPYYQKIEVQYAEYNGNDTQNYTRFEFDPSVTTMRVDNLLPGKEYLWNFTAFCFGTKRRYQTRIKMRGCAKPTDLDYELIGTNTVKLLWETVNLDDEVTNWDIEYQVEGDTVVTKAYGVSRPHTLFNLPAGKRFLWRVAANCTFGQGGWTDGAFATTNCAKPTNLQVSNITETSARLSWDAPPGGDVTSYNVRFRPVGETSWTTIIALQPFQTLSTLRAGFEYEVEVESICQVGGGTSQQVRASFTTDGCGTPPANLDWVSHNEAQIIFNGPFPPGSVGEFRVLEQGSVIWEETSNGTPQNPAWILEGMQPATSYTGQFRVACANGEFGEWRSFAITTAACPIPVNLSHGYPAGAGDVTVIVFWQMPQGDPDQYEVTVTDNAGNLIYERATLPGTNRRVTINGLRPSTTYNIKLNTVCAGLIEQGPDYSFMTRSTANARQELRTQGMQVAFSPNPAQSEVLVAIDDEQALAGEQTIIRVIDQQGRELYMQTFADHQPGYQLNLSHIVPGIYFLETSRGERIVYEKMVIAR